jgi:hypothetical protein
MGGVLYDPSAGMTPVYWTGAPGTVTTVGTGLTVTSMTAFAAPLLTGTGIQPVAFMLAKWDSSGVPTALYSLGSNLTTVPTGGQSNSVVWWTVTDTRGNSYAGGAVGPHTDFSNPAVETPVYWKNWKLVTMPLPSGYSNGVLNSFYEDATGDVYFNGQAVNSTSSIPVSWMHGAVQVLPTTGYLGGSATGGILAVDF